MARKIKSQALIKRGRILKEMKKVNGTTPMKITMRAMKNFKKRT